MKSLPDHFDLLSSEDAERVMKEICPDDDIRRAILRCLLDSVAFADSIAPDAWAVTLFEDGFRLNTGPVEALTHAGAGLWPFPTDLLRLLTQGDLHESVIRAITDDEGEVAIQPSNYKSIPQPQQVALIFSERGSDLLEWVDQLREAHHRYIECALRTATGGVRTSTTFKRSHSPGLIAYAKAFCSADVDQPVVPASAELDEPEETLAEYFEGKPISVIATRYERNAGARRLCLARHGYACVACGFDFGKVYGHIAEHYIQVHHLNPIASLGMDAAVDPVNDMRPLCANCHAVAHLRNPPYSISEIKTFLAGELSHE